MNGDHLKILYAKEIGSQTMVCALLDRFIRTTRWEFENVDEDHQNDPVDRAVLLLREIVPALERTAERIQRGGGPGYDNGRVPDRVNAEVEDLEERAKKAIMVLWGPTISQQLKARLEALPRREDGRPVL